MSVSALHGPISALAGSSLYRAKIHMFAMFWQAVSFLLLGNLHVRYELIKYCPNSHDSGLSMKFAMNEFGIKGINKENSSFYLNIFTCFNWNVSRAFLSEYIDFTAATLSTQTNLKIEIKLGFRLEFLLKYCEFYYLNQWYYKIHTVLLNCYQYLEVEHHPGLVQLEIHHLDHTFYTHRYIIRNWTHQRIVQIHWDIRRIEPFHLHCSK